MSLMTMCEAISDVRAKCPIARIQRDSARCHRTRQRRTAESRTHHRVFRGHRPGWLVTIRLRMIRVIRQGEGWSVLRGDGSLVKDQDSSGVHKTKASAVRHARRAAAPDEQIEVEGGVEDAEE